MKIIIIIIIFITFIIITIIGSQALLITPTKALDSTASASPSASLQTKLKELKDEIASRAAEFKAEVSHKLQNKAYVGAIKSKSDNSLTLTGKYGDKSVKINEFTEIKPNLKKLEMGNYVVALGDIDEADVLTAKKIIKITPLQDKKQVIFGKVLAINENIITLKTDQNLAVSTNAQTNFKIGQKDGTLDNIKIGQKVIVSGIVKNNIIKASLVFSF